MELLRRYEIDHSRRAKGFLVFVVIASAFFCPPREACAQANGKLSVGGEVEYGMSTLKRNPEPLSAPLGSSLSQDYRLSVEGGMFKEGMIDALWGGSFDDLYGVDQATIVNDVLFKYGPWFRLDGSAKRDIDSQIFFAGGANEPQSPLRSVTKGYDARLALDRSTFLDLSYQMQERSDLFFRSKVDEKTVSKKAGFRTERRALSLEGAYVKRDFEDMLGVRNGATSRDVEIDFTYRPREYFSVLGNWDDREDQNAVDGSALHSTDRRVEILFKPIRSLKVRDRIDLRQDEDTRTGEDITRRANTLLIDFDPNRRFGIGLSYKREGENKNRNLADFSSGNADARIDERKISVRFVPISLVHLIGGYDISDKTSSLDQENLRNERVYSGVDLDVSRSLRLSSQWSLLKRKNTVTSLFESNTKGGSLTMQYRPARKLTALLRYDQMETENPDADSFSKVRTISSSINFIPASFLSGSLRTSAQRIEGSSDANGASNRLLNAVEIEANLARNLKLLMEYEFINAVGSAASDENTVDLSLFYFVDRFDFSLRYQKKIASGNTSSARSTLLGDLRYRFWKNMALRLKLSMIHFVEGEVSLNDYNALLAESILSMRF